VEILSSPLFLEEQKKKTGESQDLVVVLYHVAVFYPNPEIQAIWQDHFAIHEQLYSHGKSQGRRSGK
jgi:hypothetical protein